MQYCILILCFKLHLHFFVYLFLYILIESYTFDFDFTIPTVCYLLFPLCPPLVCVGTDPQVEKQVEKVSTLSMVRRDTALLLRDFKQGASNWIHSLLDRGSAGTCIGLKWRVFCFRVYSLCLVCLNGIINMSFYDNNPYTH